MRKVFVKFSGSRSKKHATVTSILKDDRGGLLVEKRAIYDEGFQNLKSIYESRAVLKTAYPACGICEMTLRPGDRAGRFEFLKGATIGDRYIDAVEKGDYRAFFENVETHKSIFFQNPENITVFEPTEEYRSLFGDPTPYLGKKAFRITDFEATPFNIVLGASQPCLFDYECIYEFPIPIDVVLYHCVYRTLYLCMPQLSNFVKRDQFLRQLMLDTEKEQLEETWKEWRNNFSFDTDQQSMEEDEQAGEQGSAAPDTYLSRYRKPARALNRLMSRKAMSKTTGVSRFIRFKMQVKEWMPEPIYAVLKKLFRPMLKRWLV